MAEARVGEEEDSLRESRESGGGARRNPRTSGNSPAERADRNKPEQRLSTQGALSSIRAAIKRTSTRPVPPEQNRERRRPQITIVAAEPLASNAWFPSPPGAFPAAPPPPAQPSWTGAVTVQLPPPSYEQVIREKSREQSTSTPRVSTPAPPFTPSSSSSSSSSSPASHLTATISTQTEPEVSEPPSLARPQMRRPPKPPRPTLPAAPKPTESSPAHATLIELDEPDPPCAIRTQTCPAAVDLLGEPLSEHFGTQTDFDVDSTDSLAPLSIASSQTTQCPVKQEVSNRPKPRPRSKAFLQPVVKNENQDQQITRDVKVQTLVRLKDDSAQSVFASFTESPSDVTTNKYLLDLLDVFGCDEQEFQHEQHGVSEQSEKSEKEEDVGLKSQLDSAVASEPLTRPEPRPRTQNPKPAVLPKPTEQTQVAQDKDFSERCKRTPSPPVPVPRPVHKTTSISQEQESKPEPSRLPPPPRPPTVVRRSGTPIQTEATGTDTVPSPVSLKKNPDRQDKTSSSSSTSAKQASVTSSKVTSTKTGYKRSAKTPPQRRPPPPTRPSAEDSDAAVGVERTLASSAPSLPPRPSEGRVLPFRPPPVKTTKPTNPSQSSPHVPTNRGARVPKRGPPLPPRPTPGHPLYRDNTSKVPQGIKEVDNSNTKPEEPDLQQKEDLLLVFDDEPTPTSTPSLPEEKGHWQNVPASTSEKQEAAQQIVSNTRFKARFAFEGEDGELTLCEGDVILLIEYLNEEWARGSLNGHTGIFPLNFVQEIHDELENIKPNSTGEGRSGRAMYDFSPESEDELCLKVGDVVRYLEEVDDDWFVGEFAGRRGIVPKNFIQVL